MSKTLAIHVKDESEFKQLMEIYGSKGFRRCPTSVTPNPWESFDKRTPFIEYWNAFVAYSDNTYLDVISFDEFLKREWLSQAKEFFIDENGSIRSSTRIGEEAK